MRAALDDGVVIVDARSAEDFAAGHLRGSINVGFDGRFAETAGMLADIGATIVLVTYTGDQQQAALRLARVGADNTIGYLSAGLGCRFPPELRDLVGVGPRITATALDGLLAADAVTLIDVRSAGEREDAAIDGAMHIPLAQLSARLQEVPTHKPIAVYCRSGWRSSAAASLLRARGFDHAWDLAGGYDQWVQARSARQVAAPACQRAETSRTGRMSRTRGCKVAGA
jgi:rhodanese-related sulfurtransferase